LAESELERTFCLACGPERRAAPARTGIKRGLNGADLRFPLLLRVAAEVIA